TPPSGFPNRCLYSPNIPNLFMAGRDISCTHCALGSVRVMRTTAMMGEVVGMAAALCKRHATSPRGVYHKHLPELKALMARGTARHPLSDNQRYNEGHHLSD
ncbi:MAG: FAD-dependent oxidoreductase, partial [Muribaculaceae bacterium]|nr:FAD-dependent oxidoreductase [Muribaculaceae bacterium]